MPAQDKPAGGSPFEIITPGKSKKISKSGLIVGISIVIFLILSVVAGVLLVRQSQNVAEKAQTACVEQCPGRDGVLRSCTPPESDGTSSDSTCSFTRVESCGGVQYCCPAAGGTWSTNVSLCAVATATPTASASATPTVAPSESPTPTATAGTGNACNGTCGSNSNCQTGLYCYSGFCRNPLCASDSACGCSSATATPTATAKATTVAAATTQSAQTTPLPIPVTGTDWPTMLGIGVGVITIILSLLVAL